MRVAYLSCVYPPYPGGIGVLAKGMAHEIAARGHQVEVFTLKPKRLEKGIVEGAGLRGAGGPTHTVAPVKLNFINSILRYGHAGWAPHLWRQLQDFEIIHLLYPFFGVAEIIPYLRVRTKSKIVVHHTMDAVYPGPLGLFFRFYNKKFMPKIFKQAHLIITLSEDYFRQCDITNMYMEMADAPPIEFIPNGVDVDRFRPISPIGPIGHIRPIILFASGLDRAHYFKGMHVLIEAVRVLQQRKVNCRVWILGDGNMRKEYEQHAKAAGVLNEECRIKNVECKAKEAHLEFWGLAHHQDMPKYYHHATAAVVPSVARVECFSIVAAEAQSCGIPAIVSNFPGVRVTVEDGKTGYVVRPGDPEDLANRIQELVEDPKKARAMGQAGRKRAVELYDWKIIGDKLENLYQSL